MVKLVTAYLIVTGILAMAALLVPSLVVIGTFLLILPGLILGLAPTAFLWGCAFALFWFPLRQVVGDWPALLFSLPLGAGLLWAATRPENAAAARRFASLVEPDIDVTQPIALYGHILLKEGRYFPEERRLQSGQSIPDDPGALCSPLCTALLFTDGVTGVTVERTRRDRPVERAMFQLKRRDDCGNAILLTKAATGGDALTLHWAARLDEGFCIDRVEGEADPDVTIAAEQSVAFGQRSHRANWSLAARPVNVERLTVSRGSELLFRRSHIHTERLWPILSIGAYGGIENFRFGWGLEPLSNKPRYWKLEVDKELQQATIIRLSVDAMESRIAARRTIAAVLDDPARPSSDQAFATVPSYFGSFLNIGRDKGPAAEREDFDLLLRLIADPRVRSFDGVAHLAAQFRDDLGELRAPIVARVSAAQPDEFGGLKQLAHVLGSMPKGEFAQLSPAERALIDDPAMRKRVPGLVYRLHDQGGAAVPIIGRITEEHLRLLAERRNSKKRHYDDSDIIMVDRARMALCQLGPEGNAALRLIARLEAEGLVDRRLGEHRSWQLMLARIGRPVTDIPKPANLSGTTEQFHHNLAERLQRFRPDRDCQSEWF